MLKGILGIDDSAPYTISVQGSGLKIVWNLNKYSAERRLTYIHGRDYGEIFRSNNLNIPRLTNRSADILTRNQLIYTALSKDFSTQNERSRFYVDLSRPPRFISLNKKIEKLLTDPIAGKRAVSNGTDHLISTLSTLAPEIVNHNKAELSSFVDRVRGAMVSEHTIISLEGLEGSLAAAVLMAGANQESAKVRIILGPSRYRLLAKGKQIPRPMVKESKLISIYAKATGASEPDVGRHFDEWSFLPENPTVIKSGRLRGRYLTQSDISNFVAWQPDEDEAIEIPAPVPGEMQFSVKDGVIVRSDKDAARTDNSNLSNIRTGIGHLVNLIDDIFKSAHLDNWAPGALEKLKRLREGLFELGESDNIGDYDINHIALDGEAFRHVYRSYEDELSDAAKAEFSPLMLQMDLVFSQYESWKNFKKFGASVRWGAEFTDDYRSALKDVATELSEFPDEIASSDVQMAMKEAADKISSGNPSDQVGATARVQNLLSSIFRYIKSAGLNVAGKAAVRIEQSAVNAAVATADNAIQAATIVIRSRLIELASSNSIFGWMLHFLK